MSVWQRIAGVFSRSGREEAALRRAVGLAQSKQPEAAMKIYDRLINDRSTDDDVRAQALFNRALAHSMLKHDAQAVKDLTDLLAIPRVAENVREAARSQLSRVKKRQGRDAS